MKEKIHLLLVRGVELVVFEQQGAGGARAAAGLDIGGRILG